MLPELVQNGDVDHALDRIMRDGYKLVQMRTVQLSSAEAARYVSLSGANVQVGDALSSNGVAIVMALERTNAVTQFRMLLAGKGVKGRSESGRMAASTDPLWQLRNAPLQDVHGEVILSSTSLERARKELAFFFDHLMTGDDQIEAVSA